MHVFLVPVKMTMSLILTLLPYRNPVRLSRILILIIEAKQQDLAVKTYNPVNNGASYTIELSDGTSFSMYAQIAALEGGGEDVVYSPKVGAKVEHDEYYWTLDDVWLTFENDEKVKVLDENNTVAPIVDINTDG